VFCQLDRLRRCLSPRIRRVLDELPATLDETYERTLLDIDEENWEYVHAIFRCIVIALRPLRVEELAGFLAFKSEEEGSFTFEETWRPEDPKDTVLSICSSLVAIVDGEGSPVIQFSHFSVKEYLTSDRIAQGRVSRFYIPLEPAHFFVTRACLKFMQQELKFNICGLKSSYLMNDRVEDLDALIEKCIPSYLAYACEFWADHLRGITSIEKRDSEIVDSLGNLLESQLLYWLEVLSLLSKSHVAPKSLLVATKWLEVSSIEMHSPGRYYRDTMAKDLSLLAADANRFSVTFAEVISASAPHIYLSALPFAPPSSLVSKLYRDRFPQTIKVLHEEELKWPAMQFSILTGEDVYDISIHPDGMRVAAAMGRSAAMVFSMITGESLFPLSGHGGNVRTIAYDRRGKRIATGALFELLHSGLC
jgi:hypothetical protein